MEINNSSTKIEELVDLYEQKFIIKTHEFLIKGYENDKKMFEQKTNEPFEYVKLIQYHLIKIQHTIKTIQFARVFLAEKHPSISNYINNKSSIGIEEYLRYHIEHYFLRLTVYKDQILQLFNIVYNFNIKLGNGFESRLLKASKPETKITLQKIINAIDLLIEKVKPIRNKIAHEGFFHNEDLGMLTVGIQYMNQESKHRKDLENKTGYKFDKKNIDNILARTIMDNIKEMQHNELEITTNWFWVMNLIYREYCDQIEHESNIGL